MTRNVLISSLVYNNVKDLKYLGDEEQDRYKAGLLMQRYKYTLHLLINSIQFTVSL